MEEIENNDEESESGNGEDNAEEGTVRNEETVEDLSGICIVNVSC